MPKRKRHFHSVFKTLGTFDTWIESIWLMKSNCPILYISLVTTWKNHYFTHTPRIRLGTQRWRNVPNEFVNSEFWPNRCLFTIVVTIFFEFIYNVKKRTKYMYIYPVPTLLAASWCLLFHLSFFGWPNATCTIAYL